MAEIYLGINSLLDCYDKAHIDSSINDVLSRIGEGSTDVDLSGYVDASAFTEATQVTAAALVDLKKLHNEQAKYIMDLRTYDTKLDNDISTLTSQLSTKADSSNYYTKKQIDDDGKVVAAALASIDQRVSSIESSVGDGSGSGGGEVDLSVINASVNNIENDYVKSDDISTFITSSYTYDKAHIDASFIELAENSGTTDLSNYYNKSEIDSSFGETYLVKITNASGYYCYVPRTMSDADKEKALLYLNKNGGVVKTVRGSSTAFIGANCHAEGSECRAKGDYSHAEGYRTTATGNYSHAEGYSTTASGTLSHAEGYSTTASGTLSHAEGHSTTASGDWSHAEGRNTTASGKYSHAEGYYTNAKLSFQHAEGQFNVDASTAILVVGNGTSSIPHNALEIHLSGEVKISDTHVYGEAEQKPMYVLQDRIHSIDTSINNINASVNYLSGMQSAVLSNVNFVVMNEVDYELITPDPSIIYFLT